MTRVASVDEIPNMGLKQFTVDGQDLLLVNNKGKIYAIETECPHQGASMTTALVKDSYVSCRRHSYRFELEDGSCKAHPECTLKTWPVKIENGEVFVDLS